VLLFDGLIIFPPEIAGMDEPEPSHRYPERGSFPRMPSLRSNVSSRVVVSTSCAALPP
jgi:hypothetical protein